MNIAGLLDHIEDGILILAGIPGSGKTLLAEMLKSKRQLRSLSTDILSADHFFTKDGEYKFDPSKFEKAHAQCWRAFVRRCDAWGTYPRDLSPQPTVIVDNTNTSPFELAPYVRYATACGIPTLTLFVLRDFELCVRDQTHGVQRVTMERMAERLEYTRRNFPRYWNFANWS